MDSTGSGQSDITLQNIHKNKVLATPAVRRLAIENKVCIRQDGIS